MKQSWMTFVCGMQTGIIATIVAMFFIPGPAPPEGGCSCGEKQEQQGVTVAHDSREICGLTDDLSLGLTSSDRSREGSQLSLGEYIYAAAWRCRPCGYYCRCGAICRCRK
jgi:hypothetical protein